MPNTGAQVSEASQNEPSPPPITKNWTWPGYRWLGYRIDRRKHFFARGLQRVALDEMEWIGMDFLRLIELGCYSVNRRTVEDYLKAKSKMDI